jgi:hypothetical protein
METTEPPTPTPTQGGESGAGRLWKWQSFSAILGERVGGGAAVVEGWRFEMPFGALRGPIGKSRPTSIRGLAHPANRPQQTHPRDSEDCSQTRRPGFRHDGQQATVRQV